MQDYLQQIIAKSFGCLDQQRAAHDRCDIKITVPVSVVFLSNDLHIWTVALNVISSLFQLVLA